MNLRALGWGVVALWVTAGCQKRTEVVIGIATDIARGPRDPDAPGRLQGVADGGGLVPAARIPIHGAEQVARLLARAHQVQAVVKATTVWLNGAPAGRIEIDGQLAAVSLVVGSGRVTHVYAVANPRKLTRLDQAAELAR